MSANLLYKDGKIVGITLGASSQPLTAENAEKANERIANLEECLAGFMVCGAMNGMYLSPEMGEWCKKQLVGKKRTPAQVWREIFTDEK